MKRIKAACITQTLCFSNHDGETTEYAKKMIVQEYDKYKAQLDKSGTKYKILSMRLQKSLVYLRNIFKKMQSYLRREACLHMHLPDVISPENQ